MTTVYQLLGIDVALHKLQSGQELVILGIVYDLKLGRLGIKPDRREKLLKNLDDVLRNDELTPAEAAKIKGRLGFVSSHFQGRHGRAFLRTLSQRQYGGSRVTSLTPALRASLLGWKNILSIMPQPRLLFNGFTSAPAEVVLLRTGQHQTLVTSLTKMHRFQDSDGWPSFDRVKGKMRKYCLAALQYQRPS